MKDLTIEEVTQENWRATLDLAVFPEQQRFIAEYIPIAAIALAKAYIRPGGLIWTPYALYADRNLIGFTELAYDPGSLDNYWIFHFFIDYRYQGQGYGHQAIRLLLQFIKDRHLQCQAIQLSVHPENHRAKRLYTGAGFRPTGATISDEPIYRISLKL